jgi:hypothetical protein
MIMMMEIEMVDNNENQGKKERESHFRLLSYKQAGLRSAAQRLHTPMLLKHEYHGTTNIPKQKHKSKKAKKAKKQEKMKRMSLLGCAPRRL